MNPKILLFFHQCFVFQRKTIYGLQFDLKQLNFRFISALKNNNSIKCLVKYNVVYFNKFIFLQTFRIPLKLLQAY